MRSPLFSRSQRILTGAVLTASIMVVTLLTPAFAFDPPQPAPHSATPNQPEPSSSGTPDSSMPISPANEPPGAIPSTASSFEPENPSATSLAEQGPALVEGDSDTPAASATPPDDFTPFGAIGAKWLELGGETGPLGSPTSNELCDSTGTCVETFVGGDIYYTPKTGAHPVFLTRGKTGPHWNSSGGLPIFGYPVTDEVCDAAGCYQRFSGGSISRGQSRDIAWSGRGEPLAVLYIGSTAATQASAIPPPTRSVI
ncbi:hypothetical protein ACW0JT_15860 [Arthrobacter sp. SA17]